MSKKETTKVAMMCGFCAGRGFFVRRAVPASCPVCHGSKLTFKRVDKGRLVRILDRAFEEAEEST
jgi:rubrerythrin